MSGDSLSTARPIVPEKFPVPVDLSSSTRATLWVFSVVLGFVILWSVFAELHVGAVAMGEVTPLGRSKTIQHLEGGIIREIRVRDGDAVKEGQELVILDDGEARAGVSITETERVARAALVDRLAAERDGLPYTARGPASAATQSQVRLFEIRRSALQKEIAGLVSRQEDLRQELTAWQKKTEALVNLMGYADDERRINQDLYDKNFIAKSRLLALDSRSAETRASKSESEAEMSRAQQRINDTDVQITKLKND